MSYKYFDIKSASGAGANIIPTTSPTPDAFLGSVLTIYWSNLTVHFTQEVLVCDHAGLVINKFSLSTPDAFLGMDAFLLLTGQI
jgi:hypothetical protein